MRRLLNRHRGDIVSVTLAATAAGLLGWATGRGPFWVWVLLAGALYTALRLIDRSGAA